MPPSSGRRSARLAAGLADASDGNGLAGGGGVGALDRPEEGGMSRLFRFVAGWKGYAGLAVLCLCLGAAASWRVMSWREQARATQAERHVVQIVERRGRITFDVEMKFEKARLKDSAETIKRQEEVIQHVTPQVDRDYPVPCG